MEPVRTCLGCRTRDTTSALLRVVARNGEVIADQSAVLPGRGAWVHPTIECVTIATTRKAFGRAFRTEGSMDVDSLLQAIDTSITST
ncbi:YlxR family protein [Lacisediminihabitans changchengi]|uniref:YlxR family protein n=1 Tax=Lacisediminihabitans changchengi TaxID=2787634 RepID=A0A934SSX5_9MICO|nr:YlxR family protein [Lacisediminihabitans changchengi]MBK4347534.1 YlxR family protein [Lacisediminihabitans changchengi]